MFYNTEEFDNLKTEIKRQKIANMDNKKVLNLYDKYLQKYETLFDDNGKDYETYHMLRAEIMKRMG